MFGKFFGKPLTLKVGTQEINFHTLAEFEFCLAGRTEVPAKKLAELVLLSPEELKREARSIKVIEQQFVDILKHAMEDQTSVGKHLRQVDPKVFSQDHNWRDIMIALHDKDEEYDELRRIALNKYMQYLSSRQEVIKHTYAVKKMGAKQDGGRGEFGREGDGVDNPALRETVILDSVILSEPPLRKKEDEFVRLPKGEGVIVALSEGQNIELRLSKHVLSLSTDRDGPRLVTDDGQPHKLQAGKNIVGRDTVCNIIVNQGYRDVSRLHLVVERLDDRHVRLTDLSAHGTFVPDEVLRAALLA